jgi:dGTPase
VCCARDPRASCAARSDDIEDGVRLRHVDARDAESLLGAIAAKGPGFSAERLKAFEEPRTRVGYLRAMAIGQIIEESADVFLDVEARVLQGDHDIALGDQIRSHAELEDLKKLARKRCYNAAAVVEIELAGYEALGGLLEHFIPAVTAVPDDAVRKSVRTARRRLLNNCGSGASTSTPHPSTVGSCA